MAKHCCFPVCFFQVNHFSMPNLWWRKCVRVSIYTLIIFMYIHTKSRCTSISNMHISIGFSKTINEEWTDLKGKSSNPLDLSPVIRDQAPWPWCLIISLPMENFRDKLDLGIGCWGSELAVSIWRFQQFPTWKSYCYQLMWYRSSDDNA